MKIGVFDSGLGGLIMTRAIHDTLPEYDLVYLGDTLHLPYGSRSAEAVYNLTETAVDYLFSQQDCQLIIIACNTASASALRRLQQNYLPNRYPDRRILGVIVPTLEAAIESSHTSIGLIGTENIISSNVYQEELEKINPEIKIHALATPLLVPLIENEGYKYIQSVCEDYLKLFEGRNIQSLILGCTHYPIIKDIISDILGQDVQIISQPESIPAKLKDYLNRHPEHKSKISKNGDIKFLLTDITKGYSKTAAKAFGKDIDLIKIELQKADLKTDIQVQAQVG